MNSKLIVGGFDESGKPKTSLAKISVKFSEPQHLHRNSILGIIHITELLKCLQYFYIPVFKVEIYPKEVLSFLIDILEKIISWTEILFKKTISIWKRRNFAVSFIQFKQYNIPECNLVSTFSMVTVLFMAFTNFKMFFQGTFCNYLRL